jgi:hypothetical protein
MKKPVLKSIIILAGILIIFGCVKDIPDAPDTSPIPFDPEKVLTIGQLKNIYTDSAGAYTFTENYSLFATVVMDESSGNIYRSAFVQDKTGGIQLNFLNPGGLYLGDSIRILLKGATLDSYHDLFQVNNIDQGASVIKLATKNYIKPHEIGVQELINNIDFYQSTVIQLNDVQFLYSELGETFADSVNKIDVNRALEDCSGTSIIARTSGYANFANRQLPEGNGTMVAIATVYTSGSNVTPQLVIRSYNEILFNADRCQGVEVDPVPEVYENFANVSIGTNLTLTGWTNFVVAGNERWRGEEYGGNQYAEIQGYGTGLDNLEAWLITPPVINTEGDKFLSFQSAMAYWEHNNNIPLEVFASTDFNGSNFETASWTKLNTTVADASSGNYSFVESGEISLSEFMGNVAVAFKYKGSATESTTIQLDEITINNGGEPILSENFDADWGDWVALSKTGTQHWSRDNSNGPDGSPCAEMNGFEAGYHINNDWLISPPLDLTGFANVRLTFESAKNYDGDAIRIKVTENYTGDPATTSWTTMTATLSQGSFSWTQSGVVNLSGFNGNQVHVAFEYNSTNTSAAAWRIDNVLVKAN